MDTETAYHQTLDYLYSFGETSFKPAAQLTGADFTLESIRALTAALGNPQNAYPIIHIAGTKGKGSIAALLAGVLKSAGYRVGLYTSPFLSDFCEQIQIDGEAISHQELAELVETIKPQANSIPSLTTFELTTGLALYHFAQQAVDVAIIEAGLGGTNDATNLVTPLVAVIASTSYDHTQILGDTLADIAAHKAGIIKDGRPVVSAPQPDEALQVIRQTAKRRGARLVEVGHDAHFTDRGATLTGQDIQVWMAGAAPLETRLSLLGKHQVENAATAYAALCVARDEGLSIPDQAIKDGFASAVWPGRFEVLFSGDLPVVLDAAHNRESARRLAETLREYFPARSARLVFGVSQDKDIQGILLELQALCSGMFVTQSQHPRAAGSEQLAEIAAELGYRPQVAESLDDALEKALLAANPQTELVLVTGSIFIVGAARQFFTSLRVSNKKLVG